MGQSDQFRQYAEEAMLSAGLSKDENEMLALTDLAQVWILAAFKSEHAKAGNITGQIASPQASPQPEPTAQASPAK